MWTFEHKIIRSSTAIPLRLSKPAYSLHWMKCQLLISLAVTKRNVLSVCVQYIATKFFFKTNEKRCLSWVAADFMQNHTLVNALRHIYGHICRIIWNAWSVTTHFCVYCLRQEYLMRFFRKTNCFFFQWKSARFMTLLWQKSGHKMAIKNPFLLSKLINFMRKINTVTW